MTGRQPLVIAVDSYRLVAEPRTSGAVYVSEMVRALAPLSSVAKIYLLLSSKPPAGFLYADLLALPKVRTLHPRTALAPEASYIGNIYWIQYQVPRLIHNNALDVTTYVAPYHQAPVALSHRIRVVSIIHDFCGIRPDAGYSWRKKAFYLHHFNFLTARLRADLLVPISEHTREDIARFLPSVARRATPPLYNAVTGPLIDDTAASHILGRLGLTPKQYFLAYGGGGIRKGTDLTLRAYEKYRESAAASLVLIGRPGRGLGPEDLLTPEVVSSVKVFENLSNQERDALYRGALALLFPSRCEGFGYPLVEAMRQGCPPIAWRSTPAVEIIGTSAPLLERLEVREIVEFMHRYEAQGEPQATDLAQRLYHRSQTFAGADFGGRLAELLAS